MARQLARLAGRCEFFTALGDDELGHRFERRLAELGVDVHVQRFGVTRRGWVHVDARGERTITTLGEKLLPRGPLPLHGYDAVFFVSGDVAALQSARAARFLAATARELPTLQAAGVRLDLLTGSGRDPGERFDDAFSTGAATPADVLPAASREGGEPSGVSARPAAAGGSHPGRSRARWRGRGIALRADRTRR